MSGETHYAHHRFVEDLIARDQRRQRTKEKIKEQVIGWGVIAMLGALAAAVYNHAVDAVSKAVK